MKVAVTQHKVVQVVSSQQVVKKVSQGTQGPPGPPGTSFISNDPGNALTEGADGGLYTPDDIPSDPLAYYILAKA